MLEGGREGDKVSVPTHMYIHTFVVANRPPSVKALVTVTSTASDSVEREREREREEERKRSLKVTFSN